MGCDARCKYNDECDFVFRKNGFDIYECRDCHTQFCGLDTDEESYLAKNYSDAYFFEGGAGYPDYLEEKDILIKHGDYYANILKKIISPGRMLDVGAAAGFLMSGFQQNGWQCTGIEPNKHMAEFGKHKLKLSLKTGDIEHFESNDKFDLISMIQVIGHIFNLDMALNNVSSLLKDNGLLLIECWDRGSLASKLWGRKWHEYSPPSVINWYTKKSLRQIMERHGYKLLTTGRPKKQISLEHALSLVSNEIKLFRQIKTIVNKVAKSKDIYFTYPPFDLFYAIYRKETT
jgi:SAM-dependent methyltransferase